MDNNGQNKAPQQEENRTKRLLEMREEEKKPRPRLTKAQLKNGLSWGASLLIAVLIAMLIRNTLFVMIRVDGHSMDQTLNDGDRLFTTIIDVKLGGVEHGDIVICHYPDQGRTDYVKRVMGLPGDVLEIRDGVTYRNGEALEEDYVTYPAKTDFGPYTVTEGKVFVMGDNRADSLDSRRLGALDANMIVSRVRCVVWPLSRFGAPE